MPNIFKMKKDCNVLDYKSFRKTFGSISAAITDCINNNWNDFDPVTQNRLVKWKSNKDSIINGIFELIEINKEVPTWEEYHSCASQKKYYYKTNSVIDNWCSLMKEIGIKYSNNRCYEEDIVENIIKFSIVLGKTPTFLEYMKYAKQNLLCRGFRNNNKWNYLIEKAGLEYNKSTYSKEECLEYLKGLYSRLGKAPTMLDVDQDSLGPSSSIFYLKFSGGYNQALYLLGLPLSKVNKYTDEELKYFMVVFYIKHKCTPTRTMFNLEKDFPYSSIYEKRYGSWSNAIKVTLGIEHFKHNQLSYPYLSNHGHLRPSYIEGVIDDLLGEYNVAHQHDVYYKELTKTDKKYTLDILINKIHCIEIVGLLTRGQFNNLCSNNKEQWKIDYCIRLKKKIRLIKDNKELKLYLIFKRDNLEKIKEILKPFLSKDYKNNEDKLKSGHKMK